MIFHQKEDRSRCVPRLLGVRSCSLANTGLAYMIGMIACDAKFPIVELICLKLGQKTEFEEYSPVERGGGEPGENVSQEESTVLFISFGSNQNHAKIIRSRHAGEPKADFVKYKRID